MTFKKFMLSVAVISAFVSSASASRVSVQTNETITKNYEFLGFIHDKSTVLKYKDRFKIVFSEKHTCEDFIEHKNKLMGLPKSKYLSLEELLNQVDNEPFFKHKTKEQMTTVLTKNGNFTPFFTNKKSCQEFVKTSKIVDYSTLSTYLSDSGTSVQTNESLKKDYDFLGFIHDKGTVLKYKDRFKIVFSDKQTCEDFIEQQNKMLSLPKSKYITLDKILAQTENKPFFKHKKKDDQTVVYMGNNNFTPFFTNKKSCQMLVDSIKK